MCEFWPQSNQALDRLPLCMNEMIGTFICPMMGMQLHKEILRLWVWDSLMYIMSDFWDAAFETLWYSGKLKGLYMTGDIEIDWL